MERQPSPSPNKDNPPLTELQHQNKDDQQQRPKLKSSKTEPLNKRRLPKFEVPRFRSLNDNRRLLSLRRHQSTPQSPTTFSFNTESLLTKPLPAVPRPPRSSSTTNPLLDVALSKHQQTSWVTLQHYCNCIRSRCATLLQDDNVDDTLSWTQVMTLLNTLQHALKQISTLKSLADHINDIQSTLEGLKDHCIDEQGDKLDMIRQLDVLLANLIKASDATSTCIVPTLADESHIVETPQYLIIDNDGKHDNEQHHSIPDYASHHPEYIHPCATWFRTYFVGKPYITLVGDNPSTIVVVVHHGEKGTCRIIIRSTCKKYAGYHLLEHNQPVESPREVVNMVCPSLNTRDFRLLSAQETILAGMEKQLLRFEEMGMPQHYKFGVLHVRKDQHTEEEWFSNSGLSSDLEELLDLLGERITLEGYSGYAGGLDTKAGESGIISYASTWQKHNIMFHVGPLMPLRKSDTQQIHRKRHIGNDIVCLVLVEEDAVFDPTKIRSQFLHVFIVVQKQEDGWRIQVIRDSKVSYFGPTIPSPEQLKSNKLKDFLLLKMINGENAALKSDKFAIPNDKARDGILSGMVTSFLPYQQPMQHKSSSEINVAPSKSERPRSAGPSTWRPSLDSIPIPPIPSPSRSTMLRDFKEGIAARRRRRSSGAAVATQSQQANKASSPNATSVNGHTSSFVRRMGRNKKSDTTTVTAV